MTSLYLQKNYQNSPSFQLFHAIILCSRCEIDIRTYNTLLFYIYAVKLIYCTYGLESYLARKIIILWSPSRWEETKKRNIVKVNTTIFFIN